jgi:hypothetical protein
MDVTRRTFAQILAATAVVDEAEAQAPPAEGEDLKAAHDQARNFSQQLAKFQLPRATEPAFRFEA